MDLSLFYDSTAGYIEAAANIPGTNGVTYDNDDPGTGKVFHQARIVAQFGDSPWSASRFRAPEAALHLITLGIALGPPFAAELFLANGQGGGCVGSWRAHHRLAMTRHGTSSTRRQAVASNTWQLGCDFNVTLEP